MSASEDQTATLLARAVAGTVPQRIDAGIELARHAEDARVADALMLLLLDEANTAVTHEVALALLEREDDIGLRLVVRAVRQGDEQVRDWIVSAVTECSQTWEEWRPLRCRLVALAADGDEEAASGAEQLVDLINQDAAGSDPFG